VPELVKLRIRRRVSRLQRRIGRNCTCMLLHITISLLPLDWLPLQLALLVLVNIFFLNFPCYTHSVFFFFMVNGRIAEYFLNISLSFFEWLIWTNHFREITVNEQSGLHSL